MTTKGLPLAAPAEVAAQEAIPKTRFDWKPVRCCWR